MPSESPCPTTGKATRKGLRNSLKRDRSCWQKTHYFCNDADATHTGNHHSHIAINAKTGTSIGDILQEALKVFDHDPKEFYLSFGTKGRLDTKKLLLDYGVTTGSILNSWHLV